MQHGAEVEAGRLGVCGHARDGIEEATPVSAYVVSPFVLPELMGLRLPLPCETGDLLREVSRSLHDLRLPFADAVEAAVPQPSEAFATCVVFPGWTTFAGLTAVVMDLSLSTLDRNGPIIGSFLSRPTSAAEIRREAGMFSVGDSDIYVGHSSRPLGENESIVLQNGSLVRIVRREFEVEPRSDLGVLLARLRSPALLGPFPRIPPAKYLMILHHTGRSLFSGARSSGTPLHTAIINFVGVPPGSVTFHSPGESCVCRVFYRGVNIRGIVALADRPQDDADTIVLFLDLRQLAAAPQFVCLDRRYLTYEELDRLLPRPPPPGWRLVVQGGYKHTRYIRFAHRDTLTLGYVRTTEPLGSFDSLSESSDDHGEEHDESEDGTDDDSLGSTRSRSRSGAGAPHGSPSLDRSFQGFSPMDAPTGDGSHPGQHHAEELDTIPETPCSISCVRPYGVCKRPPGGTASHFRASCSDVVELPRAPVDMCTLVAQDLLMLPVPPLWTKSLQRASAAIPQVADWAVACRVPDAPWPMGGDGSVGQSIDDFAHHALFLGERHEPRQAHPRFTVEAPGTVDGFALPQAAFNARALIFVPEYRPEVVNSMIRPGMSVNDALALFQAARDVVCAERFPQLLPVEPQPFSQFASLIAVAEWSRAIYVLVDFLRVNGTLFCMHVPHRVDRETLRELVGLQSQTAHEIFVGMHPFPLQAGESVQVEAGVCIHFVPVQHPPFPVTYLADMLQSALGWDSEAALPWHVSRWLFLLSDEDPGFLEILESRRLMLRGDIASRFGYSSRDMHVAPSVPRMRDYFDFGALAQHVFVATQTSLTHPITGMPQCPYILDLRPIHRGLTWGLADVPRLRIQDLVDWYSQSCHPGRYVSASGGRVHHEDDGPYFELEPGTVITVDFKIMPVVSSSSEEDESEPSDQGDDSPSGEPSASDLDVERPASPGCTSPADGPSRQHSRSRSPGATSRWMPFGSIAQPCKARRGVGSRYHCRAGLTVPGQCGRVNMWPRGPKHDVLPLDSPGLTSVLLYIMSLLCLLGPAFYGTWCAPLWVCHVFLVWRPSRLLHRHPCAAMLGLLLVGLSGSGVEAARVHTEVGGRSAVCNAQRTPTHSCLPEVRPRGRPIATPCRSSAGGPPLDASDTWREDFVRPPSSPTRAVSAYARHPEPKEPDLTSVPDPGLTLLDSVPYQDKLWAWFNAVTLLETLVEHRDEQSRLADGDLPSGHRCPISLENSVPLSDFQGQALELHAIIPSTVCHQRPEELLDWLDNDLKGLCSDPAVPRAKLSLFAGVRKWHSVADALDPESVAVYTDGSSASGVRAAGLPGAWAFSVWILSGGHEYLLGFATGTHVPVEDPRFVGAEADTPLTCEQLAMVWALAWVAQFGASLALPTCMVYDCNAAGQGAFAQVRAPLQGHDGGLSDISAFACQLRQLACSRVELSHRHVKAHAGAVANELCDELAKRARRSCEGRSGDILPVWPSHLFLHPLKAWAWVPPGGTPDVPPLFSFEAEACRLQAIDPVGMQGPSMGRQKAQPRKGPSAFNFRLATVNILTLLDPGQAGPPCAPQPQPGLRIVAKRELLKNQFLEEGILLIGLQETRLQDTATLPDNHFVMLHASADDRGHFGVALWANTTVPYARKGERRWCLSKEHFTVVACQPRLLVVTVRAPFLSWVVVVAHAPSEPPAPPGTAAAFWLACKKVLNRCPQQSDIILLADANARVGSLVSDSIGEHDAEEESGTASAFHQFLAEFSIQLPSTFPGCHHGPSPTWTSPTGIQHRIDYVGVPFSWPLPGLRTCVWDTFEAMQLRDDHFPVVLSAELLCQPHADEEVRFARAAVRPPKGEVPDSYLANLAHVLRSPGLDWSTGIDQHYHFLATEWVKHGKSLCQPTEHRPRQSYLTLETMRLITWRKAWRSQLRMWKQWHRSRTLAFFVLLWRRDSRGEISSLGSLAGLVAWVDYFLPSIAQAAMLVYRVGKQIKQAAKTDRAAYLEGLAQAVSLSDLKDPKLLFQRVRKAFPASRTGKRSQFCPLPAVLTTDGELAGSALERQECWRRHFAEQEAGDLIADGAYVTELRRQRQTVVRPKTTFDIRCVPTLTDVEQTILGLQLGKATGYDGISAELLRVHAPLSARLLAAVYLKSALTIYEPIEFRGGSLIPLAKRASAAFSMDKFRSILVSSLPGKILHRQYRTALVPPLRTVRGDLQAGALPGVSTEAIIMTARTFRDIMTRRGSAWAMTFFDVRAAYYRVLRQVLVRTGDQEWALRKLLHELGMPPQALSELARKLEDVGVLAEAGVPEHLQHLLADAMQGTWFRVDCSAAVTLTRRGVRPGDCLADILFSFTFSAYLASIDEALRKADLHTDMPQVDVHPPWSASPRRCELSCASWADDFVHLAAQPGRRSIAARVVRLVEVFVGQSDVIGMQLTFATDKTACMLSDLTEQTVPIRDDDDGQYLNVTSPVTHKCHRLPVVAAYRHLGGIATTSGTPVPEVCFRHSLALKVIRPLRSKLFSAYGIPFLTRCQLLRSLAMSRFMFGSAALSLHAAVHRRLWAKHFVALWRTLWRRRQGEPCQHSYRVLGTAQAPTPPLALALSRAVLFRQLLSNGPSSLLQLLHVHWIEDPRRAWLSLVLEDIRHVAQYIPGIRFLTASADWLRAFVDRLSDSPCWWVAQVKAAIKIAVQDMQSWCQPASGPGTTVVQAVSDADPQFRARSPDVFACPWCSSTFPMRKHLGAHLAKSHKIYSPARHLAHSDTCPSCLMCYRSVPRVQQHLKRSDCCLRRVCRLVPWLSLSEIREVEGQTVQGAKRIRQGSWQHFSSTLPAVQAAGPPALTAEERLAVMGEDTDLLTLSRLFRPSSEAVEWIEEFIQGRSREGPRSTSATFWDARPAQRLT